MPKHPDYKADMTECPCCRGTGTVANCPCCSACCGSGVRLSAPEIEQLGGTSEHVGKFCVRRNPIGFPHGPGSLYLHPDNTWHISTTDEEKIGEYPGLFPSREAAAYALRRACR